MDLVSALRAEPRAAQRAVPVQVFREVWLEVRVVRFVALELLLTCAARLRNVSLRKQIVSQHKTAHPDRPQQKDVFHRQCRAHYDVERYEIPEWRQPCNPVRGRPEPSRQIEQKCSEREQTRD